MRDTDRDSGSSTTDVGELADEASQVARDLRDEAESQADRWTRDLGKRGAGLARALESASATLRDEGDHRMAELADRAAEQVERMAGYLEQEDPRSLMDDLERLGRSNPAAFLGTAFAAGVMGGRFFRASGSEGGNGSNPPTSPSPHRGSGTTDSQGAHVDQDGRHDRTHELVDRSGGE